ncbi:MAG: beta-lactamase family protein [Acidobacteria bacterium]|nr:beta-lactamase family protein [Acidobacteriota bacterium]
MKNDRINEFLASRIAENDFPSCVYLVGEKKKIVYTDALGLAVVEPERIKAGLDTIYDLASITKVLVTGLLSAKLIERGELRLDDPIAEYFGEFATSDKGEITVRRLLTHTSGLTAWLPFYLITNPEAEIPNAVIEAIAAAPLANPVGSTVVYSDLNFLLLGFLLEKIYAKPLNEILKREIAAPLGLKDTFYNPPANLKPRIAASENGNRFEKNTCAEKGYQIRNPKSEIRNRMVWGEVHDGNCYFMKGVTGHAGLFSTAAEVFRIAQQFLASETILFEPETCRLFRENLTPGLNEARSLAFQLAATPDSTASDALSKDSFGHLGFTGTSLWIEPETERVFILLTNRTHAHPLPFVLLNSVRRRFHELAQAELKVLSPQS